MSKTHRHLAAANRKKDAPAIGYGDHAYHVAQMSRWAYEPDGILGDWQHAPGFDALTEHQKGLLRSSKTGLLQTVKHKTSVGGHETAQKWVAWNLTEHRRTNKDNAPKSVLVLAFPGTDASDLQDLWRDIDHKKVDLIGYPGLQVHEGFQKRYREARPAVHQILEEAKKLLGGHLPDKIQVTGHSLGGAVGQLAVLDLQQLPQIKSAGTKVQSGVVDAPALGDKELKSKFKDKHQYNFVRKDSPVAAGGKLKDLYDYLKLHSPATLLPISYSKDSKTKKQASRSASVKNVAKAGAPVLAAASSSGISGMTGTVLALAKPKEVSNAALEMFKTLLQAGGKEAGFVIQPHDVDDFFGPDWHFTARKRKGWKSDGSGSLSSADRKELGASTSASSHPYSDSSSLRSAKSKQSSSMYSPSLQSAKSEQSSTTRFTSSKTTGNFKLPKAKPMTTEQANIFEERKARFTK